MWHCKPRTGPGVYLSLPTSPRLLCRLHVSRNRRAPQRRAQAWRHSHTAEPHRTTKHTLGACPCSRAPSPCAAAGQWRRSLLVTWRCPRRVPRGRQRSAAFGTVRQCSVPCRRRGAGGERPAAPRPLRWAEADEPWRGRGRGLLAASLRLSAVSQAAALPGAARAEPLCRSPADP